MPFRAKCLFHYTLRSLCSKAGFRTSFFGFFGKTWTWHETDGILVVECTPNHSGFDRMTKYQLAKLISLAGEIKSRKRVQKIICLLQAAGMKWNVEFRLHHYGPYSTEIAGLLDELASRGILEEVEESNGVGVQYNYRLAEGTDKSLEKLESDPARKFVGQKKEFDLYKDKINKLLEEKVLWSLELGSTIAHCHSQSNDWKAAMGQACEFKHVKPSDKGSLTALELAKSIIN